MTLIPQWPVGRKRDGYRGIVWLCLCHCGKLALVTADSLRKTQSCGCLKYKFEHVIRHGHARKGAPSKEYRAWLKMIDRCTNPKYHSYARWGGRGIKVCERWFKFENFLADVGPRPSPEHSLDRWPDNNGNYEPGNVRWATLIEQANNKRSNVVLELDGKRLTVVQWARELGFEAHVIRHRLRDGWDVRRTLTTPKGKKL